MQKKINKNVFFDCSYHGRYNQTERVELYIKGKYISRGSYHWENRPWQAFDFETAMTEALNRANTTPYYKRLIKKWIDNGGKAERERVQSQMRSTAMVAQLGNLFASNQKEANDWKARMLKAGMPGLDMPEDWDTLTEDEKEARLNKVINYAKEG